MKENKYLLKRDKNKLLTVSEIKENLSDFYENKYFQNNASNTFKKKYEKFELEYLNNHFKIYESFFKVKYEKILDYGCGEGHLVNYFKNKKYECYGVDLSKYAIDLNYPGLSKEINFIQGDLLKENILKNNKFDVIFLTGVAEHIKDIYKLLIKLDKHLKKGGLLIVNVPNEYSIIHDEYMRINRIKKKEDMKIFVPKQHVNYFNKITLKKVIEKSTNYKLLFNFADFPIDMFTLNNDLDYFIKPNKGKNLNKFKLQFMNLLFKKNNIKEILSLYKSFLDLGIGRTITAIYKK